MTLALELRLFFAVLVVVQALGALGGIVAIDRLMPLVGEDAARIGDAGRWGLAWLALTGFGVSALGLARFRSKLLRPLRELEEVLAAWRAGDRRRRSARFPGTALTDVLDAVDGLLDRATFQPAATPSTTAERETLRLALRGLLDRDGAPLVLWWERRAAEPDDADGEGARGEGPPNGPGVTREGDTGRLLVASEAALEALADGPGLSERRARGRVEELACFAGEHEEIRLLRLEGSE